MAKGDKIKVVYDRDGQGTVDTLEFVADAAGRKVEYTRNAKAGLLEIEVSTMAGTVIRRAELRADRVILIEEVPRGSRS